MVKSFVESSLALAALIALSPVLLLVAIGIRLSSRGPIFYRADRVWLNNTRFTMLKFRTMHTDQRASSSRITAGGEDPRVFPFGSFLRRFKIDEFPQLINILKGEMSFVGPRPEDPKFVENNYTKEELETLCVLPGLTSPGSLYYYTHGERLITPADPEKSYVEKVLPTKLALDLIYVREASALYDLRLVIQTIWILGCVVAGRAYFPEPREMKKLAVLSPVAVDAVADVGESQSAGSDREARRAARKSAVYENELANS